MRDHRGQDHKKDDGILDRGQDHKKEGGILDRGQDLMKDAVDIQNREEENQGKINFKIFCTS